MSIKLMSAWGHVSRPWGFEVRVDFVDAATGIIYNEVVTFPKEPDEKELDAKVLSIQSSLESRLAFEALEAAKPKEQTKEDLASIVTALEAKNAALEKEVADLKAAAGGR
jgi:hypothetical protein